MSPQRASRSGPWATAALVLGTALVAACRPSVEVPLASLDGVDPDVVRAIQEARAEVLANPGSGQAWGNLGDRYAVHHILPEAIRCYARAEELEPECEFWAYRLGWITFMNGSPEDAVAPLERALQQLGGFYGPAHEAYASVLVRLGRLDEAAEHFAHSSRLDAKSPQSETGLGQIAFLRGDLARAKEHLERAVARDPKHGQAHIVLARVNHALGLEEEARAHAEASRTCPQFSDRNDWLVDPSVPPAGATARTQSGLELEQQGKIDEAARSYRIAIESNPRSAMARKRLARILVKQGRRGEAIELLRDAERQGVSTALTRDYLAKLLGSQGAEDE